MRSWRIFIERTFKNLKHTIFEIKNFLDEMCSLETKVRVNELQSMINNLNTQKENLINM